jgi:hypothetical protein
MNRFPDALLGCRDIVELVKCRYSLHGFPASIHQGPLCNTPYTR